MEAKEIGAICNQVLAENLGNKSIVFNLVIDATVGPQLGDSLDTALDALAQATRQIISNKPGYERYEVEVRRSIIPENFPLIPEFRSRVPFLSTKFGYVGKKILFEGFKTGVTFTGNHYFQFMTYDTRFLDGIIKFCKDTRFSPTIKHIGYALVDSPTSKDEMQVLRAFNKARLPNEPDGVFFSRPISLEDPKLDIALEILDAETNRLANEYGMEIDFMQEEEDRMYERSRKYAEIVAVAYVAEFVVLSKRASTDFSDKAYRGFIYWNIANLIFLQELFESVREYQGFEKIRSRMTNGAKNAGVDEVAVRVFGKLDEIVQFRTECDQLDRRRIDQNVLREYDRAYLDQLQQLTTRAARQLTKSLRPVLYR
ncbi:TPA: hypothetical protein HA246_00145 [Candidatus Woesearchaeota archaeon]|nr:hypothetical protein [Candidatus Woesearchaeota archaeon]